MNPKLWKYAIVAGVALIALAISADQAAAQSLKDAQKAADKAQEAADKAKEDADKAKEDADKAPKSEADKAGDKADKQAEDDEQAARDAQDKADGSKADVDAGKPGSAQQAAKDQEAADKAREQAQKSEDAAQKADNKADKGEKNNNPQKTNREKQKEKRKKAQEAWEKQRKLRQLKSLALGPTATERNSLAMLASTGKVKIDNEGTGETIGHIADLKIQNLTDQPIMCVIPPMVLESGSGKNQHYVCPRGETVQIDPHGNVSVAMNGVCVVRNKPPVSKGVTGDLVINEGNPTIPQNPNSHVSTKQANDMLRICTSKYEAAEKLQKDGALKDLPYHDKQKQLDIVVQWSTWCDPRISELTGAPPATKEDLKKVVYKQVEEKGPMTAETKKKLDQGIDTIFEKIELTTAKAKDLEPEETPAGGSTTEEGAPVGQPEYVGQTRAKMPTPTPTPKKPTGGKPPQKPPPKPEPPKGGGKTEEKPPPPTKPDTPTPAPPAAPDYPTKDQVTTFEKKQEEEIKKAKDELGKAGTEKSKQDRAKAKLNALDKICHEVKWAGAHTGDRKPLAAAGYDDANAVLGRLDGIPDARDRLKKAGLTDKALNDALDELNGSADPETGSEQGVPSDSKYRNLAGQLADKGGLGKRESTTKEEGRTGQLVIDAKLLDQLAKDLKDLYMAEGKYNKDAK